MLSTLKNTTAISMASLQEELKVRKTKSVVLLFSMGSQFDHLIAQRFAKQGVYCQVCDPSSLTAEDVRRINPDGIVISGGPASVSSEPPQFDYDIFDLGIPTWGTCLGGQMIAEHVGLEVTPATKREFDVTDFTRDVEDVLFSGKIPKKFKVQQSHGDHISIPATGLPENVIVLGQTENSPVAAFRAGHLLGVQFHPEVSHTEFSDEMFANFCFKICDISDPFPAEDAYAQKVAELRAQIGPDGKVMVMLSGGSDSSIAAYLVGAAVNWEPGRVFGYYVKGVDRPDDEADMWSHFGNLPWIKVNSADKTDAFIAAYAGVTDAKLKRKAFKPVYVKAANEEIERLETIHGEIKYVVQGTLYTDLRESGEGYEVGARVAVIKEHHNTGIVFIRPKLEPLADRVKDNARDIGRKGGVPDALLIRHPFPGPGLTLRVEGELTREKLSVGREIDRIWMEEIRLAGLYEEIWQAGARLTISDHTTTKGDDGGTGKVVQLFAISSVNGFTAEPYPMDWNIMIRAGARIMNEVRGIGAVDIRVTRKPASTIEGE